MSSPIFTRHPSNPILTAGQWPYPCSTVFNPGAIRLKDGTTLLMCRVEDQRGFSHLCCARSVDGFTNWKIDPKPTLEHDPENHPEEAWGIEDPRITYVPDLDRYAVVYTSFSHGGPSVSLALTEDFVSFERYGAIMPPENKDATLFPHRVGKFWALIHRPVGSIGSSGAHIWISYSPDLRHWGSHKMILKARRGGWWDADRIGLSPPLIETPRGWLMLYHGVRSTTAGKIYRVGAALLDLEQPEQCLQRGDRWLFGPEADYERSGDVENVVFPCGITIGDDGDTLRMYYGAADTCIAMATASVKELLRWLDATGRDDWEGHLM
jgi:predicted GH43/DUF377 family glycosyl hydrolase